MTIQREVMEFDIVIVGAGPSGLSAAIRLMQLARDKQQELSIAVLEKGAEVGAHLLSGAVLDPRALDELLPKWQSASSLPTHTKVQEDEFALYTASRKWRLPTPPSMQNHGNFIISLSEWGRFLGREAEQLGVNIFPGFAAVSFIFEEDRVVGVVTDDKGLDKNGAKSTNFQAGIELRARYTILAEGCRGYLSEIIMKRYDLRKNANPQTYALGIKEVWELAKDDHKQGFVLHGIGWPLDSKTYGGAFLYHFGSRFLSIGYVVGLDYRNPYLNPYALFQQWKMHKTLAPMLRRGKRIAYGARSLVEGGYQSIPTLIFPGGLLIGDAAGFLDVSRIKGIHNAMKSGMLAAEALMAAWKMQDSQVLCHDYPQQIKNSWIEKELYRARNLRPAMHRFGLYGGLVYAAFDAYILRGCAPWTFSHREADHLSLQEAKSAIKPHYPAPDGKVSFDLMSSVYLANTQHDETQPPHLKLLRPDVAIAINAAKYDSPETRYCPAGVYEIVTDEAHGKKLQINAANCVHCKACDIKDPTQNIVWMPPEGGSGPHYQIT